MAKGKGGDVTGLLAAGERLSFRAFDGPMEM
jgi:hypothetical protein